MAPALGSDAMTGRRDADGQGCSTWFLHCWLTFSSPSVQAACAPFHSALSRLVSGSWPLPRASAYHTPWTAIRSTQHVASSQALLVIQRPAAAQHCRRRSTAALHFATPLPTRSSAVRHVCRAGD